MSVLSSLSEQEFNTQREQWENQLKQELKLNDLDNKNFKVSIDGGKWPTLSLSAPHTLHLPQINSWKKASQTYVRPSPSKLGGELKEDLANGVRNFFFHKEFLNEVLWKLIAAELSAYDDVEVILLSEGTYKTGKTPFKLIDELDMFTGRKVHEWGGTHVLELALMSCELIERSKSDESPVYLGVFADSQFFRNIAKIRAAKLLALKILQEKDLKAELSVIALTSYREWTVYERFSNILRNDSAVASSYIAGAQHVQSAGYNVLFELGGLGDDEHGERSKRMGRNTSHILALESLLGVVHDPAFGSYHLEGLSHHYAEEAWKEMQKLMCMRPAEREVHIKAECESAREKRITLFKTRKHVMAGINDFPDAKERLHIPELPKSGMFRLSESFEELRFKAEKLTETQEVFIGISGDYAALSGRLNFVKNYFQLLGLNVHEVSALNELEKKNGVIVLCALDEDYPNFSKLKLSTDLKFIAGKYKMPGFVNLFAGQDVYEVLKSILNRWGVK